jgi:hypothetical protein
MTMGSVTIRFSHKFPDPAPASDADADQKVERRKEGRQQFVDDFVSGVCAASLSLNFHQPHAPPAVLNFFSHRFCYLGSGV